MSRDLVRGIRTSLLDSIISKIIKILLIKFPII
jgi:hypothetical protein